MIESYQRDLGPGRTFEIDLEPEKSSMLDGINELVYLAAVTKGEHQLATILVNALEKGVAAKPDKLLRYAAFVSKDVKKPYDQAIHVDLAAVVKSAIAAVDEPEPAAEEQAADGGKKEKKSNKYSKQEKKDGKDKAKQAAATDKKDKKKGPKK